MSDEHDLGIAVHYTAVKRGTPVIAADGEVVGTVRKVQDNVAEHILDGFEIEARDGSIRFVDGPEVQRTCERGVTLTIAAGELDSYAPVKSRSPLAGSSVDAGAGVFGRLFGRRR